MSNAFALFILRFSRSVLAGVVVFAFGLLVFGSALGQSIDQESPTPIRASDMSATIAVRDLGDPRLTRHFFIFTGTPGDLVISVESKNLNGDVDIFTEAGFRPLAKISLYASEVAAKTTKSIYLRARQDLILRVEARSPNDEQGSYRIQFAGSFEPFSGEISTGENATPANETPTLSASSKKGKRVSAVGARIEEPPAQIEEKAAREQPTVETPTATAEKSEPVASHAEPARTARGKRPSRGRPPRTSRGQPAPPAANAEGGVSEKVEADTKSTEAGTPEAERKSGETGKRAGREPAATETAGTPATQAEPGPRLIIETRDGEKIERSMSTVRRLVVDNGQIIVILKTGKIERVPMANVARMSIEP